MTTLTRTPLYDVHAEHGARFTDFHGWQMPLKYGSELAEHRAVRQAAGLFDLSHMGEIAVTGADAAVLMNSVLVGDFAALAVGRAKYSLLLQEGGGIVDDLIGYRLAADRFLLVPNAGNTVAVLEAFEVGAAELRGRGLDVSVSDESKGTGVIALQGPRAAQILALLAPVQALRTFSAVEATLCGAPVLVARTGYTGEDGFELYAPSDALVRVWRALLEVGEPLGLVPVGLAARDSLRLEAGLPLYGNELTRETTPAEAGLGGVVSLIKPESFPGRAALEAAGEPARVLVGLAGLGRRAGRAGTAVLTGDETIGQISSGQPSPTLGTPIALAIIDRAHSATGTRLEIDLRGTRHPVEVTQLPFVPRGKPAEVLVPTTPSAPESASRSAPNFSNANSRDTAYNTAKEQDHE